MQQPHDFFYFRTYDAMVTDAQRRIGPIMLEVKICVGEGLSVC